MGNNPSNNYVYDHSLSPQQQFFSSVKQIINMLPPLDKYPSILKGVQRLNNLFSANLIKNNVYYNDDTATRNYSNKLRLMLLECECLSILPKELISIIWEYLLPYQGMLLKIDRIDQKVLVNINSSDMMYINNFEDNIGLDKEIKDDNYFFFNTMIVTGLIKRTKPVVLEKQTENMNDSVCYCVLDMWNNTKLKLQYEMPFEYITNANEKLHNFTPIYIIMDNFHIAIYSGVAIEIYDIRDCNTDSIIHLPYSKLTLITPFEMPSTVQLKYNKSNNTVVLIIQKYILVYNIYIGQLVTILFTNSKEHNNIGLVRCSNDLLTKSNHLLHLSRTFFISTSPLIYISKVDVNINVNNNKNNNGITKINETKNVTISANYSFTSSNTNGMYEIYATDNPNHIILCTGQYDILIIDYTNGHILKCISLSSTLLFTSKYILGYDINIKYFNKIIDQSLYELPFAYIQDINHTNDNNNKNNNNANSNKNEIKALQTENDSFIVSYIYQGKDNNGYLVFIDVYNTIPYVNSNTKNNSLNKEAQILYIIPIDSIKRQMPLILTYFQVP